MKYKYIIIAILASVGFFNPLNMFSEQIQKLIYYLTFFIGLFIAMTDGISLKRTNYPRIAYILLLLGLAISIIMATAFHPQSLMVSIMTMIPYFCSFGFLYVFLRLDVPVERIMHAIIILCLVSGVVYFANVITFPNNIFGEPIISIDTSRGIIRIPVVFIEVFPILVFYGINKWLDTKETKWLLLIAYAFLMIILSVIRQIILITAVLAIFYFFKNVSWFKRISFSILGVLVIIYVLPMIPMYSSMMELTETQRDENEDEENIRIQAWRYYTYENQTNALSPIFGNGMPSFGNSRWGAIFESTTAENGCFAADVGWAGFYWYFGIISVASLAFMVIKAIIRPKPPEKRYLTYWLIFLFITSFASGPVLYYWQIFDVMLFLYAAYKNDEPQDLAVLNLEAENDKFQLPKYPQLH